MASTPDPRARWLVLGAALLAAGAMGYGLARLTAGPSSGAAAAPEAAGTARPDSIVVDPSHLAVMQIAVQPVSRGNLALDVEAPGVVASTPGGQAVVTAQASGSVVRIAKRLGDTVRAGEALAEIASREAAAMAADRDTADARAELARQRLQRERRLFEQKVTPRQDLETAEADLAAAEAEARRARSAAAASHVGKGGGTLVVVSPIAGRITAQPVTLGAFVAPETELFRIADPRFVQIEAAAPAAEAGRVRAGDPAQATTAAGAILRATVRSVTPTADRETRAATIVLTLDEAPSALAPGETVQVEISPKSAAAAGFVVPEAAVQTVDGRDTVFVRTADGFRAVPVVVSARSNGRAAIASGLSEGQSIAVRNAFLLKAELTKGQGDEEE